MSVDELDQEHAIINETKQASWDELKQHLVPIKDGSTLLVPQSDPDTRIGQEWLRYNMNNNIRILCIDDRLFEGEFHCIDSGGNIILQHGQWINAGYNGNEQKPVGLSLFTKKWIKKVYFASFKSKHIEEAPINSNQPTKASSST